MKFKTIKERIYADYFMPSRLEEYEKMLSELIANHFVFISLVDFYNKSYSKEDKLIILRHDIDSDLDIAKKMFEIEERYHITSTYYFRLKTMDRDFMKELERKNIEVGYHFEELATYAKRKNLNTKEGVRKNFSAIRKEFENNIEKLRKTGVSLYSVSSHGDWKNRALGMRNLDFLDHEMLNSLGIFEAYSLEDGLDFRTIDNPYPLYWVGGDPKEIVEKNHKRSLILVHPRNWDSCFKTRW